MFFTKVAQSSQNGVGYLSQVFLSDFPGFLYDQIQTAAVHVLHADVDFSVAVNIEDYRKPPEQNQDPNYLWKAP